MTRVVELGVHGLDLADGLGREPWLTSAAASVIAQLLLGDAPVESISELGWDQLTLIEVATGRRAGTDAERTLLSRAGMPLLAFGGVGVALDDAGG